MQGRGEIIEFQRPVGGLDSAVIADQVRQGKSGPPRRKCESRQQKRRSGERYQQQQEQMQTFG